jgi:hypothetical protein
VVGLLERETNGLPIKGLFWPSNHSDKDYPQRNLAFRFTLTAIALSRSTAADDLELFKKLATARNEMAHGSAGESNTYPARECIKLFDRYLALAFAKTVDQRKA